MKKLKQFMVYSLWFIATLGCSRLESGPVSCRLDVEVLPDGCRFSLIVTNNLDSEVTLQFPTSQQYDFVVKSSDGSFFWKWSSTVSFAQALSELTFSPGEEKEFIVECVLPPGNYIVQGVFNGIYTNWVDFVVSQVQKPVIKGKVTKILDKFYLLGEDGTAYLIENPENELEGKTIEVTSYKTEPITGTIDKKIYIEEYTID